MEDLEAQMNFNIKKFLIFIVVFSLTGCTSNKLLRTRRYGIDYLENGDYEEALNYFNDALKLGNGQVSKVQFDILMYKAECLFMLNRYDEALKIYDTLMSIDGFNKSYKEIYDNLSNIAYLVNFRKYLDDGDIEKADETYRILKELGYEHEKSVMYNQGVLYEKKGEWKDALNSFNYFLKQYPGDKNAEHEIEFINAQLNNSNFIKESISIAESIENKEKEKKNPKKQ